jgi:hypothetical protein
LNAEVRRPFDVPENTFEHRLMHVSRRVHMETDLLHGVSNVWTCDCQILQSAGDAPECCGVVDELAVSGCCFRLGVCGRCDGVAVGHTGALQEVFCVRRLREEEAMLVTPNADAKEVLD